MHCRLEYAHFDVNNNHLILYSDFEAGDDKKAFTTACTLIARLNNEIEFNPKNHERYEFIELIELENGKRE